MGVSGGINSPDGRGPGAALLVAEEPAERLELLHDRSDLPGGEFAHRADGGLDLAVGQDFGFAREDEAGDGDQPLVLVGKVERPGVEIGEVRAGECAHERGHPLCEVLRDMIGQEPMGGVLDAMPDDAQARENAVLLAQGARQLFVKSFIGANQSVVFYFEFVANALRAVVEAQRVAARRQREQLGDEVVEIPHRGGGLGVVDRRVRWGRA